MKTITFKFDTPIHTIRKVLVGYARVTGTCEYDATQHEEYDSCYAEIKVSEVLLLVAGVTQVGTLAYHMDKALGGDYSDAIDSAIHQHCQMEFYPPVTETGDEEIRCEHTDFKERNESLCK